MPHEPKYITNLRKYGADNPTQADLKAIESELYNGPDRGAAVVLGALVERSLEQLIRQNVLPDASNSLFGYGGPLSDFNSKINMAHAMRLFGDVTKNDLTIIRHLRNQFAHSRKPIKFTTSVVRECCQHLAYPDLDDVHISFRLLNNVSNARLRQAADKSHPRTRYFTSCNEIAGRIYLIRGGDATLPVNRLF